MSMTKSERTELRSLIKQQFRVLRAEVDQRELELLADMEHQIAEKYAEDDKVWDVVTEEVATAMADANKAVHDILYRHGLRVKDGSEQMLIGVARPLREPPNERERMQLRRVAQTRVSAKVQSAKVDLDRREADLLRDLTLGALESDDAKKFLDSIPSIGELVPRARLAELEASLKEET